MKYHYITMQPQDKQSDKYSYKKRYTNSIGEQHVTQYVETNSIKKQHMIRYAMTNSIKVCNKPLRKSVILPSCIRIK